MILADPFMIFVIWRLCINIYAWQAIDVNIILHLVRLKMESDKKYIRYCFFFLFSSKEKCCWSHRIICETYGENVNQFCYCNKKLQKIGTNFCTNL